MIDNYGDAEHRWCEICGKPPQDHTEEYCPALWDTEL